MSMRRALAVLAPMGLAIGLVALTPSTAHAKDSCTTVANTSAKVWNNTPKVVKDAIASSGPYGATAIKAIKLIAEGVKIWNKLANDDSWAKIGPRRMDFDAWHTGTLIGPTERMFISGIPAVNPIEIDFHKLDHAGKVHVVVCRIPEKGKAKVIKSFDVKAGAKKGLVKSITVDDAKGDIISVVLHGKSVAKKLEYKVRAKMVYPPEPDHEVSGTREDPGRKVKGQR
jgi:hypothetical protein